MHPREVLGEGDKRQRPMSQVASKWAEPEWAGGH